MPEKYPTPSPIWGWSGRPQNPSVLEGIFRVFFGYIKQRRQPGIRFIPWMLGYVYPLQRVFLGYIYPRHWVLIPYLEGIYTLLREGIYTLFQGYIYPISRVYIPYGKGIYTLLIPIVEIKIPQKYPRD